MANFIRRAKPGSDWTANELLAYNIQVHSQSAENFFNHPLPTLDGIDPLLASGTHNTDGLIDRTHRLLEYITLASELRVGQESAVDDLTRELLRELGYEEHDTLLRTHYDIPLVICGDPSSAQTGVCLVHGSNSILLIIQGDKYMSSACEAKVIAEAIAAFQFNNKARDHLGEPLLASMTFPCIAMIGTRPIFYKVPVTEELSEAVVLAQYPTQTTFVTRCVVPS